MPIENIAVFLLASAALAFAPGPDNIFVVTQSALHGRLAGLAVTLGLCTGLIVHTAAVAVGVAAFFRDAPTAFMALKIAGAAYLLYLAWQAVRAQPTPPSDHDAHQVRAVSLGPLYRRGIIMNITNPKVALFFLAFLPQFADPAAGALTPQLLLFGVLFIAVTLVIFGGFALGAGSIGEWLRRSARAQRIMNRLAAAIFVALAARLVTSQP